MKKIVLLFLAVISTWVSFKLLNIDNIYLFSFCDKLTSQVIVLNTYLNKLNSDISNLSATNNKLNNTLVTLDNNLDYTIQQINKINNSLKENSVLLLKLGNLLDKTEKQLSITKTNINKLNIFLDSFISNTHSTNQQVFDTSFPRIPSKNKKTSNKLVPLDNKFFGF